ncbi:MAG TPA: dTDP-4-dehydrorhamnose 3,5-epimerase family protein [Kofleriaceae bacterium]|nr:dTDP-4-dehydrorhamnose 3,5-epimerase family protein [Kofleriaceae bacterium]
MKFIEQRLPGVFLIELERHADDRGSFARSFCVDELARAGLHTDYPQGNLSFNLRRHTLRGMHYQAAPHGEVKIVGCTAGAILDVVVDLRAGSPTRLAWCAVELTPASGAQLYIPAGFAHGFLTLADATEVAYRMGTRYVPDAARGLRWDDPRMAIQWPARPAVISQRDASYPDMDPELADA